MKTINSTVPDQYNSYRIDKYLSERFTYMSRSAWQKELSLGTFAINGKPVTRYSTPVSSGDIITYNVAHINEPAINSDYSVVYEDAHFVAVNKSGNLPVHPSGVFFTNTLLTLLQNDMNTRLYPLHRLDRETSGIVLFAKDRESASAIQSKFNSMVSKRYLAIVHGKPEKRHFTIDTPIGQDRKSIIQKKRAAYSGAPEQSLTHFQCLISNGTYSLLKVMPVTGRQHQIRIHCLFARLPIMGDKLYGIDDTMYLRFIKEGYSREIAERLGFHRTALHSHRLIFYHPYTQKKVLIKARIPADMSEFLHNNFTHQERPVPKKSHSHSRL